MSIKSNIRREKDNEAKVVLKNLRISPQKLNLVLGMIRSQKADVAISKLQFSKKRISKDVEKALKSVISNAENNHSLDIDKLYVKEAFVGKGIVMKRFHARARGRGARILKPFSHLTIILSEETEEKNGSKD
jgi:large subunit ribosomal protein L22